MLLRFVFSAFLMAIAGCATAMRLHVKPLSPEKELAMVRAEVTKPRLTEAEAKVVLETPPIEQSWRQDSSGLRTNVHVWRMEDGTVLRILADEWDSEFRPESLRVFRVREEKAK